MMGFGGFNNMNYGGFMGLGIILLIGAAVFFAYKQGYFEKFMNGNTGDEDAHTILAKRFAAGEISREEYEEMKNTLNK
ncbi:MAG: SHOCT domain-containing protein [Spirochaetaceae bacterium]|jgi:uncharacterized membrane protein|nr:SHOCT domain-containing protein [Spirochaetaceae bacterium]